LEDIEIKPTTAIDTLVLCDPIFYKNIYILLTIFAALPVSTCTTERSFSILKYLKSYLRNTIDEKRLNGLALLYIHQDIKISPDEIPSELMKK
jgi:hAT family C-terminal dimerisation region